jgi:hypothetical protein
MFAFLHNCIFNQSCASLILSMSLPEEQSSLEEPSAPIGRKQTGSAASFETPNPKKGNVATDSSMKNLSSTRGSHQAQWLKRNLNNGEHRLIPVTAKMIHSAVFKCKRFVLKDSHLLHMVRFVGAVRNYSENMKNVMIDVEDGTGLVQVILWQKQNECTAVQALIHKCNGNGYICVVREVTDYYGVHKIMAFDVCLVSSGTDASNKYVMRRVNL